MLSPFYLAVPPLLAVVLIATSAGPALPDIMSSCKAEIGRYCEDVRKGKGRVAACLIANSEKLDGACASDVQAAGNSRSVARFVPSGITELKGTPYEAELRAACTSDAARLCPSVSTADERILACLYARESKLSGSCTEAGKRVLSQIK
ncbi:cysteine rich repeat-containing protein [Tropicimonas marinistellae]|uniref:cysteine rich repeat-containing protein n=1 Tax=Tropicimonas marinistellae TaxID=1739787 RepID=UPI00098E8786